MLKDGGLYVVFTLTLCALIKNVDNFAISARMGFKSKVHTLVKPFGPRL